MYKSIHEVPRGLRTVNGAQLTLAQINKLLEEVHSAAKGDGSDFAKLMGAARQKFRDSHVMAKGLWVVKGGEA
jgi:hypothetical protein